MAAYGNYRRYRRYIKRSGKRAFSSFNLYKRRTSKAQAYQIYRLNKKIARIQYRTKPEIKIAPLVQRSITSASDNDFTLSGLLPLVNLVDEGTTPTAVQAQLDGRFARLQNVTLKGVFNYATALAGNPATPTDNLDLQRLPAYMRLVIVQLKTTRSAALTNDDVWTDRVIDGDSTSDALNGFARLRAPLSSGMARKARVLCDKTYMLSDNRQAVNVKCKLKYLKNWYKAPEEEYPKGGVYMFVLIYNLGYSLPRNTVNFQYVSKCAYTDA